jgi:hypothetical protein
MRHDLRDRAGRVFRHDAGIQALTYKRPPNCARASCFRSYQTGERPLLAGRKQKEVPGTWWEIFLTPRTWYLTPTTWLFSQRVLLLTAIHLVRIEVENAAVVAE